MQKALALTLASDSRDGAYFKIAQDSKALAEKEGLSIDLVETNGSLDNINLLGAGEVGLAITQLDVLQFVARKPASTCCKKPKSR